MIAAVRADELEHIGVAAFQPAFHDADRLAPQGRRRCRGRAGRRAGTVMTLLGPVSSPGSRRSCGRGTGMAAGQVPAPISGSPRLLTRLTA